MSKIPFANMFIQRAMGLSLEGDDLIVTIIHKRFIRYSHETVYIKDFVSKDPLQLELVFSSLKKFQGEIILSWPREYAIVREIQYPHSNLKEFKEALGYQLDSFIPFSNEDVYFDVHFDSHSLSQSRQDTKVFIVAVKKVELDPILSKLRTLEVTPARVIISPFAFLPVFRECEGLIALVHKNTENYSLNLYANNHLVSSSIIQTEAELINRIKVNPPDEIGFVNIDNGRSFPEMSHISSRTLDDNSESHGAALYGLSDYSCDLSLIKSQKRRLNPQITLMCFLVGALIFFAFLIPYIQKVNNTAALKTVNTQIQSIKKDVFAMEKLRERIGILDEAVNKINEIKIKHTPRIDAILELAKVLPYDAWIKAITFEKNSFEIEGDAVSSTNLIPILENSPIFSGVGLTSPVTKTQNGREKFRIRVNIKNS
ncbi:MAG: hypothetical protein E3K32_03245 [wastewater metagenome]|nr:hypothetical protein [Candidatus Loosdrechtia aerotolerans]